MTDQDFRVKNGLRVGTNANIGGSITSVDSIQFDPNAVNISVPANLKWNPDESTLDLGLDQNVTLQIGQEIVYYVKNQTGSVIRNGNVVMALGTLGSSGRILAAPALANGTYPSKYILGIATEDIANGEDGFVTSFGKIRELNTTQFSEGDILYADPSIPGGLSNTVPQAPNNIVTVAIVINRHQDEGVLFVRPTYGSSFVENESVHLENVQSGQSLVWVSANSRFENQDAASASGYQANDYTTYNTLVSEYHANDYATYTELTSQIDLRANLASPSFTGNVGIGVTNATSTLQVAGTVTANAFVGDGSGLTGVSGGSGISTGKAIAMAIIFG